MYVCVLELPNQIGAGPSRSLKRKLELQKRHGVMDI